MTAIITIASLANGIASVMPIAVVRSALGRLPEAFETQPRSQI